eukprot:8637912-Heterocapsa_arctica.AAC.1
MPARTGPPEAMGLPSVTMDLHQHPLWLLGHGTSHHVQEGLAGRSKYHRKPQGTGARSNLAQQDRPRLS